MANYCPVKDDPYVTYAYVPRDVYGLIPPFSGFISYLLQGLSEYGGKWVLMKGPYLVPLLAVEFRLN